MEASGHARWFTERLLAELKGLRAVDRVRRRSRPSECEKQKTRSPGCRAAATAAAGGWLPRCGYRVRKIRDLRHLLWRRHRLVQIRTRDHESVARRGRKMKEYAARKGCGAKSGPRHSLESLPLAPWSGTAPARLTGGLLDRLNPTIQELSTAVEQEAQQRPRCCA